MQYEFTKTSKVEDDTYEVGTVIEGAKIPAGSLQSLLWTGGVKKLETPPAAPAKPAAKKSPDTGPAKATGAAQ